MDIAVKFININKEDVVATSCAKAGLPVVQCIQYSSSSYQLRYDNGPCDSVYYYFDGIRSEYLEDICPPAGKYHVEWSDDVNAWVLYTCTSNCTLSSEDPFRED